MLAIQNAVNVKVKCTNYCHSGAEHTACEKVAEERAQNTRPLQKRNLSPTTEAEVPMGMTEENEVLDGDVIHDSSRRRIQN